jgi:hypothetical protein
MRDPSSPFQWKEGYTVTVPDGDHGFERKFDVAAKQNNGAVSDLQTAERFLEQNSPEYREMMKKLYPRIYEDTGRYHSPRLCAAAMAMAVHEVQRVGLHRAPTAYRLMMLGMAELIEKRMPTFFIAPDLLEAIMRTDFRDDINWLDMHLPYETGIFMLPKGTLPHPTDGDTSMILWARNRKGPMRAPFPGVPAPGIGNTAFVLLALCPARVIWIDSTLTVACIGRSAAEHDPDLGASSGSAPIPAHSSEIAFVPRFDMNRIIPESLPADARDGISHLVILPCAAFVG